jgi:pimeloyl-ACP methyl ester carboxylesterase
MEWVTVDGSRPARLATSSLGKGQPFLWAHSLLGSMAQDLDGELLSWRKLADTARVIRYDARGHGQSESRGEPEDFSWDAQAHNMWQVVEHYTQEPVVLGGASMGCAVSLHAACLRPEQVQGLVLVIPPTAWEARKRMRRNYRIAARVVELTGAVPFRVLHLVPPAKDDADPRRKIMSAMARHLAGVKPRGVVGAMRGAALSDLPHRDELEKLRMPALILAWPGDRVHPLSVAELLHETLPNSQLDVMGDDDDLLCWPQRVADFITDLNKT